MSSPSPCSKSGSRPILRNCLLIALGVGSMLSLINQYEAIRAGPYTLGLLGKIALNFMIPFGVSLLSAAMNRRSNAGCDSPRVF